MEDTMSKSFVEKVKKGAAKLADKVEQKVEQFVDTVPTDDEIMDKLRDGFKKINSKVAQVSQKVQKLCGR
jgi:thiamine kinase-like enzyme